MPSESATSGHPHSDHSVREADELRSLIAALSARVDLLENAAATPATEPSTQLKTDNMSHLWALETLQWLRPQHPVTESGVLLLSGSVTLPNGTPVEWQESLGTVELFDIEWNERATALAALGHPVRLELLRHVLRGTTATADLATIEALGTTGQLHHHLRELRASGWLRQAGRGSYEVPSARVVPLLICLMAAQ